jgi:hypothetical protein
MSLNTIRIPPEDLRHSKVLRRKLLNGSITVREAYELERILENERHMAINEGNVNVLASIHYFLRRLEIFLAKHGKKRRLKLGPIKPSNT